MPSNPCLDESAKREEEERKVEEDLFGDIKPEPFDDEGPDNELGRTREVYLREEPFEGDTPAWLDEA